MRQMQRRDLLRLTAAAGLSTGLARLRESSPSQEAFRFGFIGVGARGTGMMKVALSLESVEVTAICDIDETHLRRAIGIVKQIRGNTPAGYSAGPTDYRSLLDRPDVDGVFVATPEPLHAQMATDSLRAGKHVLSEVAAAITLDDCWALVEAAEQTGRTYMLAENVCYYRSNLAILNMVRRGLFGDLTYAECGYVHEIHDLLFNPDGSLTWRGELFRQHGNMYPTHPIGPVAQWMGINRGDRLILLTALESKAAGVRAYAGQRFGSGSPPATTEFGGDTCFTLVRTEKGRLIQLQLDVASFRPHPDTTYFTLQGTTASYRDYQGDRRIWIQGKSRQNAWEPPDNYFQEYDDALWKKWEAQAVKTSHAGSDLFPFIEFLEAVRSKHPPPIDAYDAATWSCIIPLSAASIRSGGKPQDIPDFTRGRRKLASNKS